MEQLERRTKFMSTEMAALKDTVWRLIKRVTALEGFIRMEFGIYKLINLIISVSTALITIIKVYI